MIRFSCPSCSKSLKVDAKYAGRKVACPKCSERLRVPAEEAPKPAVDEPTPEVPTPEVPPAPQEEPSRRSIDDLFDEEFEETDDPTPPLTQQASPEPPASESPPEDQADDEPTDEPVAEAPEPPTTDSASESESEPSSKTYRTVQYPIDPEAAARVGSREKKRPDFTPELSPEDYEAWEKYVEDERRAREKPAEDELDMTPMVDVTFLLLIFFMVTVSFQLQESMRAEAPESEQEAAASAATEDEPEEEPIIVEVTAKNEVFIDGRKVPLPEIGVAIGELKAAEPRLELMLEVDRGALHGSVVQILDAATAAGVTKVKRSSVGG